MRNIQAILKVNNDAMIHQLVKGSTLPSSGRHCQILALWAPFSRTPCKHFSIELCLVFCVYINEQTMDSHLHASMSSYHPQFCSYFSFLNNSLLILILQIGFCRFDCSFALVMPSFCHSFIIKHYDCPRICNPFYFYNLDEGQGRQLTKWIISHLGRVG